MPSPFGIRRRLKKLFGMAEAEKPKEPEREKIRVTVVGPDGSENTATTWAGTSVLSASGSLRRPIASGCADSTCGTCHVDVLEGAENLSEQSARERATLKDNGHPATQRLACRADVVRGEVKVKAYELV